MPYRSHMGVLYVQWVKYSIFFICFLVFFPIMAMYIPSTKSLPESEQPVEGTKLAFASTTDSSNQLALLPSSKVLVYFAHPEEAYKPITEKLTGQMLVSHQQQNIQSLSSLIKQQFELQLVQTDILNVNVAAEINARNLKYKDSYAVIRPFIQQAINQEKYDLILDIHRDAAKKSITTTTIDNLTFAKIALVVGSKHENYEGNLLYAQKLHEQLNAIAPTISRGILKKGEVGANGIYNQDLARNVVLVEIGGVDNTEDEIMRTIAVLARAIANMKQNEQL